MSDVPEPPKRAPRWPVPAAVAVAVVFVLVALPFSIWQMTSNSDEARYTVAAARMMATGDYVIPYAAWGEVRLLKPPLTYYYVVAGFALLGQSVFAVKSMWILSAVLILGLTWGIARGIGATKTGAAMAVAALAGNLLFFRAALTHNPDIPMTLGIALSLLGWVRILSDERPPAWSYYAAWLGIGWAFLAKGLLALVLVAVGLGVRAVVRGFGRPGRTEIVAVIVAVILGGWWHLLVAIREPTMLVAQFFGDQVTRKAMFDPAVFAGAMAFFALFTILGFIPVLLAAVPRRVALPRRPSPAVAFLILWIVTNIVVFSFSSYRVPRYMLPALPAAAALIGLWFSALDGETIARRAGRAVRILLPLFLVVGLGSGMALYMGTSIMVLLAFVPCLVAVLWLLWRIAGIRRPVIALAMLVGVVPLAVLSFFPAYLVLAYPAAADYAVRAVRDAGLMPSEVYVLRQWRLMDRVGLRIPPIEEFMFTEDLDPESLARAKMVLTVNSALADELADMGWTVRRENGAPEEFDLDDFLAATAARDLDGFRAEFGEPLFVATPPQTSDALPLGVDQPEVPAVDENAEGLPQNEDGVGAVERVSE